RLVRRRIGAGPSIRDKRAAEEIARLLPTLRGMRHAPPGTDRDLAYWFLWAQLLRVSRRLYPTLGLTGEWRNLRAAPLYVLRGRSDEVILKAWRRWLYSSGCYHRKGISDAALGDHLSAQYPRFRNPISSLAHFARVDVKTLIRVKQDLRIRSDAQVFAEFDTI